METVRTVALSLIGLVLAASLAAAQEQKPRRVGIILLGGPGPSADILREGLAKLSYDGRNLVTEFRYARGQSGKVPELAAELVQLDVDVIVAVGAVGVSAARNLTTKIPIVFSAVLNPVALGYAQSLERPGGNITGITSFDPEQATKQFEILKELNPKLARVAILSDENVPRADDGWSPYEKAYDAAAKAAGLQAQWFRVKGPTPDLQTAFAAIASERAEAVLAMEMPVILQHLKPVAELAAKQKMPSMFPSGWPNEGLISFGTTILDATPRIPGYVDKILKGAKAGELPIEVVKRRELTVNLKTAQEIGVEIPPAMQARADRVIR